MEKQKHQFRSGKMGAAITVRVTPRASRNEIIGISDDGTVKIRLTAPPVEGAANEGLVRFLAEVLGTAPSKIEIIAGQTGKDKLITIMGMDSETVQQRILSAVER